MPDLVRYSSYCELSRAFRCDMMVYHVLGSSSLEKHISMPLNLGRRPLHFRKEKVSLVGICFEALCFCLYGCIVKAGLCSSKVPIVYSLI